MHDCRIVLEPEIFQNDSFLLMKTDFLIFQTTAFAATPTYDKSSFRFKKHHNKAIP